MTQPVKDEHGFWIYRVLPPEASLFTMEMYRNGDLKKNMPFIIHSQYSGQYQCWRIIERNFDWVEPFILANRMYYLVDSTAESSKKGVVIPKKAEFKLKF
jgi:hypothetical protein